MEGDTNEQEKRRAPLLSQESVTALNHGLRIILLRHYNEETTSPSDLAKKLGEDLSHVSYHTKVLADCGFLVKVGTAQRRGATENYYKATKAPTVDDQMFARLPQRARESLTVDGLTAIFDAAAAAVQAGTFDKRTNRHMTWMGVRLDGEGWGAMMDLLKETLERANTIKTDSEKRLDAAGEKGIKATVSLLGFESAP